jgi:hypothetical protein
MSVGGKIGGQIVVFSANPAGMGAGNRSKKR